MTEGLLWGLSIVLMLIGIAGTILPLLPGAPLFFLGALLAAWIDDFEKIGWIPLSIIGVLCVLCVVVDYVASALGAKRYGASSLSVTLSLIGTVVGISMGPIGLVVGPLVGAVAGELISKKDLMQASKVGIATVVAIVVGNVFKLCGMMVSMGILLSALYF